MFIGKDQDWQNETTIYWFNVQNIEVEGFDYNGVYGIVEGSFEDVLHDDYAPVFNDYVRSVVLKTCVVTDDMRG